MYGMPFHLKHKTSSPRKASYEGEPKNGHAVFARPQLVPRDNVTGDRTPEALPAFRVATPECSDQGTILKLIKDIKLTAWRHTSPLASEVVL